jgi:hypothetical protein
MCPARLATSSSSQLLSRAAGRFPATSLVLALNWVGLLGASSTDGNVRLRWRGSTPPGLHYRTAAQPLGRERAFRVLNPLL